MHTLYSKSERLNVRTQDFLVQEPGIPDLQVITDSQKTHPPFGMI